MIPQPIKLSKSEAIRIAQMALIETIAKRQGIWTYLNENTRRKRTTVTPYRTKRIRKADSKDHLSSLILEALNIADVSASAFNQ